MEKAENLELELQQCYKAQSWLSEQLVVEVAECRSSKALIQEKEALIANLQNELSQTSEENSQLKQNLDEKTKALDLSISENCSLKAQLDKALLKLKEAETESKNLIDRWMLEKMKDAEKLNEVVDNESVLFEPKEKLEDGVPIRIYGTYEYLYVDPVKCSSEVENILKQENMCISEAFQKALEEDLSHLRSGGKSKRQVSKTKGYQSMKNLGIVFEASLQPFEL